MDKAQNTLGENSIGYFENLRNALSKMKRGDKVLLACPQCGSTNIKKLTGLNGWLTPEQYVCEKCGYQGLIIVEVDKKQSTKPENSEDTQL